MAGFNRIQQVQDLNVNVSQVPRRYAAAVAPILTIEPTIADIDAWLVNDRITGTIVPVTRASDAATPDAAGMRTDTAKKADRYRKAPNSTK